MMNLFNYINSFGSILLHVVANRLSAAHCFVGEVWESFGPITGASAMPKNAGSNRLTPLQIKNFKGPGVLEDGAGLRLVANAAGSRWWALRIMIAGV
jgi:hypothetical protein